MKVIKGFIATAIAICITVSISYSLKCCCSHPSQTKEEDTEEVLPIDTLLYPLEDDSICQCPPLM